LIRFLISALLLTVSARWLGAAEPGQLDGSPALFSVLTAINAAGYDADIDSPANHPLRAQVRKYMASRDLPVIAELKRFFANHKRPTAAGELSQYISFALSTQGPPDFKYRFPNYLVPPDVQPLLGFEKLMVRFHREAGIDELWNQVQPAYEQVIARYHEPVSRAILEVNAYLRNTSSGGYLGRRFQIYLDLMGAPNQIHNRGYESDYVVVITPSPEPQVEEVRHAYLHYVLEPLVIKYKEQLDKKKSLIDYAIGAPALDESYKEDFVLLTTESLIKAVESRLAAAGRQEMVTQAVREGFILAPFFSEQLPVYEKQEAAMRLYIPDIIDAIDIRKEVARLDKVQFASEKAPRKAQVVAEPKVELSESQKLVTLADQFFRDRAVDKAREAYLQLLKLPERELHSRAYYGLARIALLERKPEEAEKLLQKTVESSPDPETLAWAHIYLGRLSDAADERTEAVEHYKAALAVPGIPPQAREAAEAGLKEGFRRPGGAN
jgi:hypothetical protein